LIIHQQSCFEKWAYFRREGKKRSCPLVVIVRFCSICFCLNMIIRLKAAQKRNRKFRCISQSSHVNERRSNDFELVLQITMLNRQNIYKTIFSCFVSFLLFFFLQSFGCCSIPVLSFPFFPLPGTSLLSSLFLSSPSSLASVSASAMIITPLLLTSNRPRVIVKYLLQT